jgi:hypothetical protein
MSIMQTLVSLATNGDWKLHQHDVKNIFFHGDLVEKVYMNRDLAQNR